MALTKTNVRLPMAGLDQGTDPKSAQGLLLLENSRQERKDEFVKRNGLYPLAGSYADANLTTYKGRPVLFGPSGVYTLDATGTSFTKADDAGFFDVDVEDIGTGGAASVLCIQVFEDTNILVVCYVRQNNVSGTPTYHLSTYDKSSLRLLATTTSVWKARVFKQAATLVYVTQDTVNSKMAWGTINATTGAIRAVATCTGSTNTLFTGTFDCCGIGATATFGIVHTVDPGGAPELIVVGDFTATPTYAIGAVSVSTVHAVTIWPVSTTLFGVAYAATVSEDVFMSTWDITATIDDSPVMLWGWSAADDKCVDLCAIGTTPGAGTMFMTLGTTLTTDTEDNSERVIKNTYSGAGIALAGGGETDPFQEGSRLLTKPFADSSGVVHVVLQRQGSFTDGLNKCCLVINSNQQIVAHFLMDKAVSNLALKPGWLGAVTDLTDKWRFGVAKLSGYETSHVAAVTLTKLSTGIKAVEAHGLLVLPGAHPWIFDGTQAVEMGFIHYPHLLVAEPRESWDVLNDLVTQYSAHIQLGSAPTNYHPNGAAGTNDIITATSPATTNAEAYLLANDLKAKLVAHAYRTSPTGHGLAHTITVTAADATDYDTLVALVTELQAEYEAHRVRTTGTVHGVADGTNVANDVFDGTLDEASVGRGYQQIYEHYLATGQVERSAPSPVVSITNEDKETVKLTYPHLHHTVKANVFSVIYRTEANKATLKRLAIRTNDQNAYEGTTTDSASDATIASEPSIYTTGHRLENLPPPPSRVFWTHGERLFCINREAESWDVRYSLEFADGEALAFNDVLQVKCPAAGGRIYAGASMLGRGILFKKGSIYTFYGDGLGATGVGTNYSDPEMISTAIGCTNQKTVVDTPLGVMFLSEDGIYLLDQQWNLSAIGKPVKYHTDVVTISGAAVVKDRHYAIWTSNGVALVYDYLHGSWSTFTGHDASDVCVDSSNVTWIKGTTTIVHYEKRTQWTDGSEVASAVRHLVRSAWIAADEYQRVHAIGIIGQNRSDHTLRVKIAFDYRSASNGGPWWEYNVVLNTNALPYQEGTDHYNAPSPGGTAQDALIAKVCISRRCRAFMVEVTDETRSGGSTVTKGFSINGLDLLVSPKTGLFKPGGARQVR